MREAPKPLFLRMLQNLTEYTRGRAHTPPARGGRVRVY
jgi:hypothetical protein